MSDESRDGTREAQQGPRQRPTELRYEIVLHGYRNDLAKARILERVEDLRRAAGQEGTVERDAPLPRHILGGLSADEARRITAILDQEGALVRILPEAGQQRLELPAADDGPRRKPFAADLKDAAKVLFVILVVILAIRWHFEQRQEWERARPKATPAADVTAGALGVRQDGGEAALPDGRQSFFSISFAQREDQQAATIVLAELERAHSALSVRMGPLPDERTDVVLYDEPFRDLTMTPEWSGGLVRGRVELPVRDIRADDPTLQASVRYAYTRFLVERLSRDRCPVWLEEGIAMWAAESYEGERIRWAAAALAGSERFTLTDLQQTFREIPASRLPLAQAQSYAAFRLLLYQFGWRSVQTLLEALAGEVPFDEAFASVFRTSVADFQGALMRVWAADVRQKGVAR